MRILSHILRFVLGLIALMPSLGTFGIFPQPTADMYSTVESWDFISALANTGYMMPLITIVTLVAAILLFINRTALAAIILLPFSVNVICFHIFLDATPISAPAIPGYALLLLNLYFVWVNREKYKVLLQKN